MVKYQVGDHSTDLLNYLSIHTMSKMPQKPRRMSFAEAMALLPLSEPDSQVQRLVAEQPAWFPGKGMAWERKSIAGMAQKRAGKGITAAGIHVYAQAPLAAARVVEREESAADSRRGKIGIHVSHLSLCEMKLTEKSIQGVYTNPGLVDRPFIYEVSKVASGRSFSTRLVNVRQPLKASIKPDGPFTVAEAERPQGEICFTCLTTFKRHFEGKDDVQAESSPQERFADILSQRKPDEWPPCPQIDLDIVQDLYPDKDHGAFPVLDMYKVNMRDYNERRPVTERRELILYRPSHPIDKEDVNAHIVCHGAESDRNGFLMLANYLGYGYDLSAVASLSYSFYIHVNPEEAVMDGDGWWIQEVQWPRTSAGRGMMETRTWSPEGKHVASGYQDGQMIPGPTAGKRPKL